MNDRSTRIRQCRPALLWGLGLFAVGQLVLLVDIERWQPYLQQPEYGYRAVGLRRWRAKEPGRPLILALGTSRTEAGCRFEVLPPYRTPAGGQALVFNFGAFSSGPLGNLLIVHRLLAQGIRPDWLLVEVFPPHLQMSGSLADHMNVDQFFWDDLPVLGSYSSEPRQLYARWLQVQLTPASSQRLGVTGYVAPWLLSRISRGFQKSYRLGSGQSGWMPWSEEPTEEVRRRRTERAHGEYATVLQDLRLGDSADRLWRELLGLCRREGIQVALYLMPEGSEFQSWYTPQSRQVVSDYLDTLRRDFDVRVIDARNWIDDGYFIDSHHLLPEGATLFTQRLGREVIQPLVNSHTPPR